MPRIIVILMLISVLFYLVYRFKKIQTDKQKLIMKYMLIFIMVGVIAVLAVSGHLNWLIALIAALIPLLIRFFSSAMRWLPSLAVLFRKFQTMRSAQNTQIVTGFLRMEINQSTGDMRGQILQGEFKNKMLSGLGVEDLLKLLDSCQQQDKESAALLMAYLDRHHHGWKSDGSQQSQGFKPGAMSAEEARDILAVKKNATHNEIIQAHRKLMQKLHPDRGGSDYLAAKINQAKDTLLP